MIKKALAFALAAVLALSLCACGEAGKAPDASGKDPDSVSDGIQSPDGQQDGTSGNGKSPAFSGIEEIASLSKESFGKTPGSIYDGNDKYGRKGETVFAFDGGDLINILEFSDEEAAKKYASYYNDEGDHFDAPDESIILCYAMPMRMWQSGSEIISYSSSKGELYNSLVSLLGKPFVSGGEYNINKLPTISENDKADELISAALSAFSSDYESQTYELEPNGEDGLGAVSEEYYTFDNGDSISIVSFESKEKAGDYFACFKDNGDTWENGDVEVDMEYEAPAHLWLINSQVVTYCSESGEYLETINGAIGTENMGAGYDYFLPDYAAELVDELAARGISFKCRRTLAMQNPLYMYSPKSICTIECGINTVYVSQFSDEAQAKDHAARFTPDGKYYTGLQGDSTVTIGFGRQYPLRLFRKGDVVVEYSAADDSLLPSIEKVYGVAFAATNSEANYSSTPLAAQDMAYEATPIRTDGYNSGVSYPQYAVIRSKDELDVYYSAHRTIYDLERRSDPASDRTVGFLNQADKYTKEWFENNDLVLILLEEGSGSIRHEVRGVVKETDGSYTVSIARLCPQTFTDDMAEWHLFLEMKNCKITPLSVVNVEFISESVD